MFETELDYEFPLTLYTSIEAKCCSSNFDLIWQFNDLNQVLADFKLKQSVSNNVYWQFFKLGV